jgi:hypothetical protein
LLFGNWFVAKYSQYATKPAAIKTAAQATTNKPTTDQVASADQTDNSPNDLDDTARKVTAQPTQSAQSTQSASEKPFDDAPGELPAGDVTAALDAVEPASGHRFSTAESSEPYRPETTPVATEPDFEFEPPATSVQPVERTWTTTNGRQADATFVRLDGDVVILMRDGRQFKIPLNVLSDDDLLYVNSLR